MKKIIKKFINPTKEKINLSKIIAVIGIILAFLPTFISQEQEVILTYLTMIFLLPPYLLGQIPGEGIIKISMLFITFIILLFYWYLLSCTISFIQEKSVRGGKRNNEKEKNG